MSGDRPTHIERLHGASISRDLRHSVDRSDVDYLTASGMAARRAGISAEISLRPSASVADLHRAAELVEIVTGAINKMRRWGLSSAVVKEIAGQALAHHQNPACQHCGGTGKRLMNICTHCKGSGQHPIPKKHREEIDAVLNVLRDADERVAGRINALMR